MIRKSPFIPFLQTHAVSRTSAGLTTTTPTDTNNATSNSLRSTSTRFSWLNRSVPLVTLPIVVVVPSPPNASLDNSRALDRANAGHGSNAGTHGSVLSSARDNPFRDRLGGAGRPFRIPVLSSSASVPLSLGVLDQAGGGVGCSRSVCAAAAEVAADGLSIPVLSAAVLLILVRWYG